MGYEIIRMEAYMKGMLAEIERHPTTNAVTKSRALGPILRVVTDEQWGQMQFPPGQKSVRHPTEPGKTVVYRPNARIRLPNEYVPPRG